MDGLENNTYNIKKLKTRIDTAQAIHCAFIAGSQSGKNVLLFYIMSMVAEMYQYIHVITGSKKDQYKNLAFSTRICALKVITDHDVKYAQDMIQSYVNQLRERITKSHTIYKHLLILDDLGEKILSVVKNMLFSIRHSGIHIYIVTQNVLDVPSTARPNIDYWFANNTGSIAKITKGVGELSWANDRLKKLTGYLDRMDDIYDAAETPDLRKNLWLILDNNSKKGNILKIPPDFFKNNFSMDKNNKYEYIGQHLVHQHTPPRMIEEISKNNSKKYYI